MAINKRRKNKISQLIKYDNTWIYNHKEIEMEITNYLKNTYRINKIGLAQSKSFPRLNLPNIQLSDHPTLIRTPDELEIKYALFCINPLKTSRDDGLHAIFYQNQWDTIKDQLIHKIQLDFIENFIPSKWGTTLLYLIPKIENAHLPNHYRPLGLCNTYYKIL